MVGPEWQLLNLFPNLFLESPPLGVTLGEAAVVSALGVTGGGAGLRGGDGCEMVGVPVSPGLVLPPLPLSSLFYLLKACSRDSWWYPRLFQELHKLEIILVIT